MTRFCYIFLVIFTTSATKFVYAQSIEFSIYGGLQSSPHSRITGKHSTSGAQYSELVGWEGKSLDAPIYYGVRTTFWRSDKLSYGAEFTHTKAYAPNKALQSAGFDRLEFTDGHNIITLNINKRWELGEFNTYSLVGLGIAIPHVDALPSAGLHTFEYQYSGPAVRGAIGLSRKLNVKLSIFTEYQFTASDNKVSLRNGGSLNTKLLTNAFNVGVSYNF
ncbi:MAG: lipid A oxidase [Rhodobacteraceae bacterium]|nr:lipid A oxidase [Paracoccaceae bacterium]